MKRLTRFLLTGAAITVLSGAAFPLFAQDNAAAGQGGNIVRSNIGDDPSTFNPIISNDNTSAQVTGLLYPAIIATDNKTFEDLPNIDGGMALSWEYDETGTVLTLKLREDLKWDDGTPITADDYMWSYNATKSGLTSSPRTNVLYKLDDGTVTGGTIFNVEKIDDYTLKITLGTAVLDADGNWTGDIKANCTALNDINDITPVPAHIFSERFGTDYASMDDDPYFVGENGTWGPFKNPYPEFGVQVSLEADQQYPDTVLGYVAPTAWIYRQVDNTDVEYTRFLAGDFTYLDTVVASKQNEMRANETYKDTIIEHPSNGYVYMAYNMADPNNPVAGSDDTGKAVEQPMHPIFGDVKVRQALAHAVDTAAIIGTRPSDGKEATGILQGNGYPIATHNHPGLSWVDPQLEPYTYDLELAGKMLDEAGWKDEDGDGVRECHGCKYSVEVDPSYEGTPFEYELITNAGNKIREAIGETIKTQFAQIGVKVDFQAIEFGTLIDEFTGQTFDALILGWNLGLPFDPDGSSFFSAGADIPGSGFNGGSYYNKELEDLWDQAVSVPGCAKEDRIDLYRKAMKIIYDEQPYLFLYAGNTMSVAQPNVVNWDPLPYAPGWNLDAWSIND
jgi:peptide/nickel transport system substrate-binding protein